ncbi:hypothetical protein HID58_013481 [Brassica napus]|uniref:Uncharacterized protein n=1 Tax=Brassica napus TaxID=3708 RepID=A0ABQ8E400_BRANA|nr:hypothetical protein HID58_013481 [Brassica napus]
MLVAGPILISDFLQSLVHAGSGSYPQIRSPQSLDLSAPSLNLKASLYILWPLLVSGLNCKACLYNRWIQYSQPGAVITNIRISG